VKDLFASEAQLRQGKPMSPESLPERLIGIIFLGANEHFDFPYYEYLGKRISGSDNANMENFMFGRRLLIINTKFLEVLQRKERSDLALTTWILPAPIQSLEVQVRSAHVLRFYRHNSI
jgi:hypothetical protein